MPIYEYRCDNEHRFEAFQPMADDALDMCEVCGAPVQRVLSAPAVHCKGSGFYTTDYARQGKQGGDGEGGGESKGGDGGDSGKGSEKKADSGLGSDSGSSSNGSSGSKSESKSGSSGKD